MVKKTHSLQEFRKMITVEYISKGIKPLTPNGEKEIQSLWLLINMKRLQNKKIYFYYGIINPGWKQ